MKILHVITSLRTGGAEKLMVDLIPRLKEKGFEVDLLLLDGTETSFRKEAEEKCVTIYNLGIGGSVYSPIKLFKLIPFLRRYDIVHTHNTSPQLFAAIGNIGGKTLLCTTEHTTSNRRRKWKWLIPFERLMYNSYKHVICISQKAEDNLREHIGKSRATISTINNGVDIERYSSASASLVLEAIAPNSKKIIMVSFSIALPAMLRRLLRRIFKRY